LFIELTFTTNVTIFFTSVNARLNTFDLGLPHNFKHRGAMVNSSSGIKNAMVKCLFIFISNWIHQTSYVLLKIKNWSIKGGSSWVCTPKIIFWHIFKCKIQDKIQVIFNLRQAMKAQTASRIMALLALTSLLEGSGRLMPQLSRFLPWKDSRYTMCRKLDGPRNHSGWVWNFRHHRDSIPGIYIDMNVYHVWCGVFTYHVPTDLNTDCLWREREWEKGGRDTHVFHFQVLSVVKII